MLDYRLQGDKKIPCCKPRSCWDIYVGKSPFHVGDVLLVFNPRKGHVSPLLHVIFDDQFHTVNSTHEEVSLEWPEMVQHSREFILLGTDHEGQLIQPPPLSDDWHHSQDYPER